MWKRVGKTDWKFGCFGFGRRLAFQVRVAKALETVGAFQKLPMVMPSIDILYSALKKAKRVSPTKGNSIESWSSYVIFEWLV